MDYAYFILSTLTYFDEEKSLLIFADVNMHSHSSKHISVTIPLVNYSRDNASVFVDCICRLL